MILILALSYCTPSSTEGHRPAAVREAKSVRLQYAGFTYAARLRCLVWGYSVMQNVGSLAPWHSQSHSHKYTQAIVDALKAQLQQINL